MNREEATEPPLLRISGLTVETGACQLLCDVSWEVRRGEHWAVLGANGSGKTTLLRTLQAFTAARRGTIEVLGQTFGRSDWRALRARLGFVSAGIAQMIQEEEAALSVVASGVGARLNLGVPPRGGLAREARAVLKRAGCERCAERRWGVLSQGERQRVLIARALMAQPELLFLDEPCAGLDPVARWRFLRFVEGLMRRRGGPGIVLVTHHVEELTSGIGHVLLLRQGRRLAAGPRDTVLTRAMLKRTFGMWREEWPTDGGADLGFSKRGGALR